MAVLYSALRHTLLVRLKALHEGTIELGKGNLAYRLPRQGRDEIGSLADAFNNMTEDLQRTTVSRDDLAREIDRRKLVEGRPHAQDGGAGAF